VTSFIVTIDQGSSATKVLAFDRQGHPIYRSSRSLKIERPFPAHVEQDPIHVLQETKLALDGVLSSIFEDGHEVMAIGLACQRSSFLLWDRGGGRPLTPILSWQDLRAKDLCTELTPQREMIYRKTGLPLTGHYGGPKFLWFLKNHPEVSKWIHLPKVVFSPWNSFLLWHLTEERTCVTDESVAGRTLFFNIRARSWDEDLLRLFRIPERILPETQPTCHLYGHYPIGDRSIPIASSIGDHQAALIGLGGLKENHCGLNYGTSAGVLMNIGREAHVVDGLLTNILYSTKETLHYAAEGTVNAVGSLFEWFEKEKGISNAAQNWVTQMAPSSKGWMMIPGMYGIAAPYWKETVPTEFMGEGESPSSEILLRAGMESIAFLVTDILDQLKKIPGFRIDQITAGGGAAQKALLQFQSDLLGLPIHHSAIPDATALGCAFLTGLQAGFWKDEEEMDNLIHIEQIYSPQMSLLERQALLVRWRQLLKERGIRC
jgi:glycerol kinase